MRNSLTILFLYLIGFNGFGQQPVRGPHGGNMATSSVYKIEMLACTENYEVYLYDTLMQPIHNAGIEGSVTYQFKDKPEVTVKFHHWGIDGFSASGPDDFVSCRVLLLKNGRPITAVYKNEFSCEQ